MSGESEVQVKFGADITGAEAGADRVKGKINELGKEVEHAEEMFKHLAERMVELFALHEIAEFVEKMSELGEQALRASAMLGMTVEQVQQLQYAAKLAGTDSESLNQSMIRFERNIANAQKGAGNAAEAFHNLGISQDELKNSSPTELLYKVADAFHGTADGAEKVQYAIDLGGRSWAQMIPFLDRGSEALKKAGEDAKATASIMTKEQAEALEVTHQGLERMEASWRGVGLSIMTVAGPAIDELINGLAALAKVISDSIKILRDLQIEISTDFIIAVARLKQAIDDLGASVGESIDNMVIRWKEMGAVMTAVATGKWSLIGDITAEANEQVTAATKKAQTAILAQGEAYRELRDSALKAMDDIRHKQAEEESNKPKLGALEGGYGKKDNTERQLAEEEVRFKEAMGRLEIANRKSVLDQEVAMGEISKSEEFAQLQKLNDGEYALERKALEEASQIDGLTVVERQKIADQMLLLHQKYLNQREQLTRQALDAEKKQYDQIFQGINRAFSGAISGIIQGTQTWQQATAHIFTSLLASFADMAEQMASKWLESKLLQAIYGKEEGVAQIGTSAAEAGAAAFASTAAIPIIGPELAPAAAAAAYSGAMAFQGLLPLEVGAWEIPKTMPALLHPGEMVVPATYADGMRNNGGGGGDTYHIHAVDAQSFVNMLKNNSAAITGIVSNATRNFSGNMQAWKAA